MSPAAVLARSIREAEAAELLAVIHANIPAGEAFTRELIADKAWAPRVAWGDAA